MHEEAPVFENVPPTHAEQLREPAREKVPPAQLSQLGAASSDTLPASQRAHALAPEPDDLRWENLEYDYVKAHVRYRAVKRSQLYTVGLLLVSFVFLGSA